MVLSQIVRWHRPNLFTELHLACIPDRHHIELDAVLVIQIDKQGYLLLKNWPARRPELIRGIPNPRWRLRKRVANVSPVDEIVRAELQNQVRPQVSIRIQITGIERIAGAIQIPDVGSIAAFFDRCGGSGQLAADP